MSIEIVKSAVISRCGRYRYELTRRWAGGALLPFVMLNPSVADAAIDDPTIRRCIGFASGRGFGGIRVVNLFGLRSTDPSELRAQPNPVGPENDEAIYDAFADARFNEVPVIAAWGVHGVYLNRDRAVMSLARSAATTLSCLGMSKAGHPRHPLYIPATQPFVPFPCAS